MLVKDIRSFRKWLKGETDNDNKEENFIGFSYPYNTDSKALTKARGFFNVFHNQAKDIEGRLSTVLDMAQDSQAIYEFVQNAVDCNSTAFFMFYDHEHFIAINNGEPFTVDGIRSILNFAQSTKTRDENIGKFGVGFKLIHRMVGAGNGLKELTEDYTGPMLFSWSNKQQLLDLLNTTSIEDLQAGKGEDWDNPESAWFFKILLTCVPVLPNNLDSDLKDVQYTPNNELFTAEEFTRFKSYLTAVWQENQEKFNGEDLNQGSLFYLRLGKEKQEKLNEDYTYFKTGIQYSLSFVASLMSKKGINKIYFNKEEPIVRDNIDVILEPPFIIHTTDPEFAQISPWLKENDRTRNINLIFGYQKFTDNPNYGALRTSPNFYKFFPMGKEVCGFNFIVHSNIFEIEASRREFVQKDRRNIFLLEQLTQKLILRLDEYKTNDFEKFKDIYLALLFSSKPNQQQWSWIDTSLYQPLYNYIAANCPTDDGKEFLPAQNVVLCTVLFDISPADVGIADKKWFYWADYKGNEPLINEVKSKLKLEAWDTADLIEKGTLEHFTSWYRGLEAKEKAEFNQELAGDWKSKSSAKFWSKIASLPDFIDLVYNSDSNVVKLHYIKNLPTFTLDANKVYTKDDFEFKVLTLAVPLLKEKDLDEFRSKVVAQDGNATHKLLDVRENNKIRFENPTNQQQPWQLNLSDVLPNYQDKSGLLSKITTQFDKLDLKLHTFFGVGKQKSVQDVYTALLKEYRTFTNPYQFVFLGLLSREKSQDYFQYFNMSKIFAIDILDIYCTGLYPFPKTYSHYLAGFKPDGHVYPDEWAVEEERLPDFLKLWLQKGDKNKKLNFLSSTDVGVNMYHSAVVNARRFFKGDGSLTPEVITAIKAKKPALLLNTLIWLKENKISIKGAGPISQLKSLLKAYYADVQFDSSHPQLYVLNVSEAGLEYRFEENSTRDYYLDEEKVAEIAAHQIDFQTIFSLATQAERPIMDFRMYPSGLLKKQWFREITINNHPDFDAIHAGSFTFELPFFVEWGFMAKKRFRFYDDLMPRIVSFEDHVIRLYKAGDYCKNDSTSVIYVSLDASLEDAEKAERIVQAILNLPEEYVAYPDKKTLQSAFNNWKDGDNTDITKIRKKQVEESCIYTFEWLKNVFDWEYDCVNRKNKQITVSFENISIAGDFITLSECSFETVPAQVEFMPEAIELAIKRKNETRSVLCELYHYSEFELLVKVVRPSDLQFLSTFKTLESFTAFFKIPGEDLLMYSLRQNLFGSKGVAPIEGDIRQYLTEHFSQKGIRFLFGPPGTGKTTKVALDVLYALYSCKRLGSVCKILLLTPTNKAADVVIERIVQLISNTEQLRKVADAYYAEELVTPLCTFAAQLFSSGTYRDMLVRFGNSVSNILNAHQLIKTRKDYDAVPESIVLATTVHRLVFDKLAFTALNSPEMGWTNIVVDEASMVSLPHMLYTLLQFRNIKPLTAEEGALAPITLAGDPFQIQPVGQTPNYIEQSHGLKGWATENIYSLLKLEDFSLESTPVGEYPIERLLVQYRSVPAIGEFFSKFKYKGQLVHHQQVNIQQTSLGNRLLDNIQLITFPIYPENEEHIEDVFCIHKYGDYSAYHIYTVVLACELAAAIKLQNPTKTVGIITPYSTQARLAKEVSYFFRHQDNESYFNVSTIHRYQGDENDIIILMMNPPKTDPFQYSHFNNPNLINVGISRAKEHLIILHPERVTTSSVLEGAVKMNCEGVVPEHCSSIENILFAGFKDYEKPSSIRELVEVRGFHPFNVCDLKGFVASGKEYLFLAGNKNVNVIGHLSKRFPLNRALKQKPEVNV